jgi:hypothetical protein
VNATKVTPADLWAILPLGKARARLGRHLASELGLRGIQAGTAALRAVVNEGRRAGLPIGSCREGYYRIANEAERAETVAQLEARIAGITAAIAGLNETPLYADSMHASDPALD